MDISGTLTVPLLRFDLPSDAQILYTQPAFTVKLLEEANMYKIYTCAAANIVSQTEGINFEASYSPTSFWETSAFSWLLQQLDTCAFLP
eukprot:4693507-Ditylum_brightwellii.AAC.1